MQPRPSSAPGYGPGRRRTGPYPTSPGPTPTSWPRSRLKGSTCCPRRASHGGGRVGAELRGGRDQAACRRLPTALPVHPQGDEGPAPRPAGQPGVQLCHEDAAAVRVREASPGGRVGGELSGGQDQRHPAVHSSSPVCSAAAAPTTSYPSVSYAYTFFFCCGRDIPSGVDL